MKMQDKFKLATYIAGREIKPAQMVDEVSQSQKILQREIANSYIEMGDNELGNPIVRKSYNELSNEILDQYLAMPIKVEVFKGKGEPYKNSKALMPLKLGKYFTRNGYKKNNVKEMDWFDKIKINDEITITMLPSQHWSKRWIWGDGNNNRTLWGSFLIEYKGKKIFFACDTGPAPFYKDLGKKYGPIDLGFGNLGAYNFYPIVPVKDKSTAHANPEELLSLMKDLRVKKVIGMHWGTAILSLEPIWEPPVRFKANAEKFGYKKEDAVIFKIGEIKKLDDLIN